MLPWDSRELKQGNALIPARNLGPIFHRNIRVSTIFMHFFWFRAENSSLELDKAYDFQINVAKKSHLNVRPPPAAQKTCSSDELKRRLEVIGLFYDHPD